MKDKSKYIVQEQISIGEALVALNNLSDDIPTLFVINKAGKIVGSLTDGDVRRRLISGGKLEESVSTAMNPHFHYLKQGLISIEIIRLLRKRNIELVPYLDEAGTIIRICNIKGKNSLLPIDAVLMAGGKGLRLRPLTNDTPKPLLKVGNKPIIDYNVDSLISYGIDHIFVTVNYLREQIEDYFKDPRDGVSVLCVREPKYLGTIGSVKFIEHFYNDTVLIMNSDLFTNINYEDFYAHFCEQKSDMAVAAVPYSVSVPYGIFELNGGEVRGIKEKPVFDYYANAGIYLIKRELLACIPDNEYFDATDFLNLLLSKGYKVTRFPIAGYWLDIGKLDDFNKAQELVTHL